MTVETIPRPYRIDVVRDPGNRWKRHASYRALRAALDAAAVLAALTGVHEVRVVDTASVPPATVYSTESRP